MVFESPNWLNCRREQLAVDSGEEKAVEETVNTGYRTKTEHVEQKTRGAKKHEISLCGFLIPPIFRIGFWSWIPPPPSTPHSSRSRETDSFFIDVVERSTLVKSKNCGHFPLNTKSGNVNRLHGRVRRLQANSVSLLEDSLQGRSSVVQ